MPLAGQIAALYDVTSREVTGMRVRTSSTSSSAPTRAVGRRALLLAIMAMSMVAGAASRADTLPVASAGSEAARALDFSFEDINPRSATHGQRLTLSELYPRRGLVLNFMASWCGFCWKELPELQKLHAVDTAKIVGMAADEGDETGEVRALRRMLEKSETTIPVLYVPTEELARIESFYDYSILPATYLIDGQGIVRHVFQGKVPGETLQREIRDRLGR